MDAPARPSGPVPKVALLALAACTLLAPAALAAAPDTSALVRVGAHRLWMRRAGTGTPVVVIDAGLGDGAEKVRALQDRLARETAVVAYDRAGYGRSEPGPFPRDAGREADELRVLLDSARVTGPVVLVGHSLGALIVQVFAKRYPKRTAGLVLLDPPPLPFLQGRTYPDLKRVAEGMTARWQALADSGARSPDPRERGRAAFYAAIASEHHEMFGASARLAASARSFGDRPLVVIAAGRANPAFGDDAGAFQRDWIARSRALAARSKRAHFVLAEKASHQLYTDAPDLVADRILGVVREVRERRARR